MAKAINLTPDLVAGQVELAKRLGVTRQTITEWRKQGAPDPTSNNHWSVPDWRAWMEENGKSPTAGGDDDENVMGDILRLKVAKTEQEVRKLTLLNDEKERLLIPRQDVEIMLMSVWVGLNTFIQSIPGRLMLATRGVSDDLEKQAIYQRQADQMIRIINEFAEHLDKQGATSITWECGNLKQLFDSLQERAEKA